MPPGADGSQETVTEGPDMGIRHREEPREQDIVSKVTGPRTAEPWHPAPAWSTRAELLAPGLSPCLPGCLGVTAWELALVRALSSK